MRETLVTIDNLMKDAYQTISLKKLYELNFTIKKLEVNFLNRFFLLQTCFCAQKILIKKMHGKFEILYR